MLSLACQTLDLAISSINSNPFFIGSMMLLLNFGGRFLAMEMSKGQEQFFQNSWVRRGLIFTIIFVGTRNIVVAFWMSLIIILLIGYLFNENSSLCLFNLGASGSSCATEQQSLEGLTPEESEILKRLSDKQQRLAPKIEKGPETPKQSSSEIYWQNMGFINGQSGFRNYNPRF
jgi:hypothetical protein